jgi:hypothetical protein
MTSWPNQEVLNGHGLNELEAEMKKVSAVHDC